VGHKLRNRFCDAKLNFVNSYLLGVHGVEKDTTLIQFSGENCFQLSQYVNSQNNRFPMLTLWHLASGTSITHCDAQKTPSARLRWQHLMAFLM